MRQSPMLEYPVAEFEQRKTAAAARMKELGLDYIMGSSKAVVCHLTGLRSVAWKSKLSTPGLVLMNSEGTWGVVGSFSALDTALYTTCLDKEDFYFFEASGRFGVGLNYLEAICYTLRHLGFTKGRIGCELSSGIHLHMDLGMFHALRQEFPELEFVDASYALWDILAEKSSLQIKNLRAAEAINQAALREGEKVLVPGEITEMCLYKAIARAGYLAGSEHFTYMSVLAGPERALCADCPPSEHVVIPSTPGTVVRVEGGGVRRELNAPFTANYVVGGIQPEQQEAWNLAENMLESAVNAVKAGAPAGSVAEAADRCAAAAGKDSWNASRGFAGSGIGWGREDGPLLQAGNPYVLRENMVLTVAVAVRHPSVGELILRQNVVVNASGADCLAGSTGKPIIV